MKKTLIRFYLWLSILLLAGSGQLYARQDNVSAAISGQALQGQADIQPTSLLGHTALINYTTLRFETQHDKIETSNTEEEEEEELSIHKLHFVKKIVALHDKDFFNSYYANAPGLTYESLVKIEPSGKPLHSLSSRQYILFRVIRI